MDLRKIAKVELVSSHLIVIQEPVEQGGAPRIGVIVCPKAVYEVWHIYYVKFHFSIFHNVGVTLLTKKYEK